MPFLAQARRVLRAVHTHFIAARLADRELMAMRTSLTRHSGSGCSSTGTV